MEGNYKTRLTEIQEHLRSGGIVQVLSYTRATHLDKRHVDYLKATDSGLYMRSGRKWVCINFNPIRFGRYVQT